MVKEITEVSSPRGKDWCMEKAHGMRNGLGRINRTESTRLAADIEIGTGPRTDAQLILPSARDESMGDKIEIMKKEWKRSRK